MRKNALVDMEICTKTIYNFSQRNITEKGEGKC